MVEIISVNQAVRMTIIIGADRRTAASVPPTPILEATIQKRTEIFMTVGIREWAAAIIRILKTGSEEEIMIATVIGADTKTEIPVDSQIRLSGMLPRTRRVVWRTETSDMAEGLIMEDQTTDDQDDQTTGEAVMVMEEVTATNARGGTVRPMKYHPGLATAKRKEEERETAT